MGQTIFTASDRYRHVVFTAAPRRPLNLGTGRAVGLAMPAHGGPEAPDDAFIAWLFRLAGLSARHYRPAALRRRLPACLRALRAQDTCHARRLLRRNEGLVPLALDAMLLGVTEFFRDADVFDWLARELPWIAAANAHPLRIWSAGCSDGAELHSVAILLGELNLLHRCELLGTDCRHDAIARASTGAYKPSALRGVSAERLAAALPRQRMTWRRADVLAGAEPGPWDVILCRNLAMYLQPESARRLWEALASVLRPGGLLVAGKAERPVASAKFTPIGPCVYRRGGGA